MLYVLKLICIEQDDSSAHNRLRIRTCDCLTKFYDIVKASDDFLSEADAGELLQMAQAFLVHNNWLLEDALAKERLLYCHTTKYHMFFHIAAFARYQSPRTFWCYELESFIGHMVLAAKACLAGTNMELISAKVLENYLLTLQLTLATRTRSADMSAEE